MYVIAREIQASKLVIFFRVFKIPLLFFGTGKLHTEWMKLNSRTGITRLQSIILIDMSLCMGKS